MYSGNNHCTIEVAGSTYEAAKVVITMHPMHIPTHVASAQQSF